MKDPDVIVPLSSTSLAERIPYLLLDLSILVALFIMIVWEGRYTLPVVCSSLAFALLFSCRGMRFPVALPFFVLTCGLICFWMRASADDLQYCDLGAQPCPQSFLSVVSASLSVLALTKLSFYARPLHRLETVLAVITIGITIVCTVTYIKSAIGSGGFSVEIPTVGSLSLAGAFLLVAVRAFFSSGVSSWSERVRYAVMGAGCMLAVAVIVSFYAQFRGPFELPERSELPTISSNLLVPLLVAEDPIFFRHQGVDFRRLREALREGFELGYLKRGGSTISMQLVKVLFLNREKTFARKFHQCILALLLERRYTKEEILRAYLEAVPFAEDVVGLEAASLKFFHKSPQELLPEEGLKLVLSIYDPGTYSPLFPAQPKTVMYRSITIRARERIYGSALRRDLENGSNLLSAAKKSPVL